MHKHPIKQTGFSLVELSIVLVILGLLVGGVMSGQSLIKAAELRAVTTEYNNWQTAVRVFQDKYFAIPGDFTMATRFWGDNTTHCADGTVTDGVTCNGNGDGVIDYPAAASQEGEMYLFWQHLALAGLIQGEYDGIAGSGGVQDVEIGDNPNSPASKYGNGGWNVEHRDTSYTGGGNDLARTDFGNFYQIGTDSTNGDTDEKLFTPEEAWNIDTKIDDGLPAKGMLIARFWDGECFEADSGTNAKDDFDASYRLSDSTIQCSLAFRDAF